MWMAKVRCRDCHLQRKVLNKPQKSLKQASLELQIPKTEMHKIIIVILPEQPSQIQVQAMLQEEDNHVQLTLSPMYVNSWK
jgi:hypothetical protein